MTTDEIRIELAKAMGRKFNRAKTEHGFFMLPCPKCSTHRLTVWDCGYSSFNCGGVKCKCGYKFDLGNLSCFPNEGIVKSWNQHVKLSIPSLTLDWLHEIECAIPEEEFARYQNFLWHVVTDSTDWAKSILSAGQLMIIATKEQRAKAYLLWKNLWRETR